jgi:UDP-glucose 4-epimerase
VRKVSQVLTAFLTTNIPSGIYNLSDKNLEILDILQVLKKIYPALEYFHINQHITMQELKVEPKSKLYSFIALPESDFEKELTEFKAQFAF